VKYAIINSNEIYFAVGIMSSLLSASRSWYYKCKNRPFSDRDQANQELLTEIKRVFEDKKSDPPHPETPNWIKKKAHRLRVVKLMKDNGLCVKAAKIYSHSQIATTP
jgi:hypothetical protein